MDNRNKRKWDRVGLAVIIPVLLLSLILSQCGAPKNRPNMVVILIDTLRADHCSLYGYERNTTPNLERIAAGGLKLGNFFANSPWTKPSVASIITGLYPTAHGSRVGQFEDMELYVLGTPKVEILNSKIDTMAEVLKSKGYQTHAFVPNYHMTPKFGYHQGYDHYNFNPEGAGKEVVCRSDKEALDNTLETLTKQGENPRFIWCHLMSVHGYQYPAGEGQFRPEKATPIPETAYQKDAVEEYTTIEEALCSYDNSIYYLDRLVGDFFDALKEKAPNTILVVMSDHGEEFYDHGGFEHCHTLYNELLKVPCVFWGPGVPVGTYGGLSDTLDIMPTLLENAGIKPGKQLKGNTLFTKGKLLAPGGKVIFAEQHHRGLARRFALIDGKGKIILNEHKETGEHRYEFYPGGLSIEKDNMFSTLDKEAFTRYKNKISLFRAQTAKYFKKKVGPPSYKDLSPEDIKHLKSLGYID